MIGIEGVTEPGKVEVQSACCHHTVILINQGIGKGGKGVTIVFIGITPQFFSLVHSLDECRVLIVVMILNSQLLHGDNPIFLAGIRLEKNSLLWVIVGHEGNTSSYDLFVGGYQSAGNIEHRIRIFQMRLYVP